MDDTRAVFIPKDTARDMLKAEIAFRNSKGNAWMDINMSVWIKKQHPGLYEEYRGELEKAILKEQYFKDYKGEV